MKPIKKQLFLIAISILLLCTSGCIKKTVKATFIDYDGTVLKEDEISAGDKPTFSGSPKRAADEENDYNFVSWDKPISSINSDTTYRAIYEAIPKNTLATDNNIKVDEAEKKEVKEEVKKEEVKEEKKKEEVKEEKKKKEVKEEIKKEEVKKEEIKKEEIKKEETKKEEAKEETTKTTPAPSTQDKTKLVYNVIFYDNDGTILQNTSFKYGSTPYYLNGTPPAKYIDGKLYSFTSWDKELTEVKSNQSYTAVYRVEEINIKEPSSIEDQKNNQVLANNKTKYTISVDVNNMTMGEVSGGGVYEAGSSVTLKATPFDGYVFLKWNNSNRSNPMTVVANKDQAYIAEFIPEYSVKETQSAKNDEALTPDSSIDKKEETNLQSHSSYVIEVNINGSEKGYSVGTGIYEYDKVVSISAHPYTQTVDGTRGYHFVKWDDGNTDNPREIIVKGSAKYNAILEQDIFYTVQTKANVDTYGTVDGSGEFLAGTKITLTAKPNSDYVFYQWDDGSFDNPRTFTLTNETGKVYTAIFKSKNQEESKSTITVVSGDYSLGSVNGSGTYTDGTEQIISAIATKEGYKFSKWNDENTDNPRTIMVDGDAIYIASFCVDESALPSYSVTVLSNNENMGSVLGGGVFNDITEHTIAAIAKDNYRFISWNDGNTDNPRTVIVAGDKTYTAIFAESTFPNKGDLITLDNEADGYKTYRVMKLNGTKATLMNLDCLDKVSFNDAPTSTYSGTLLDKYCNETFFGALSNELQNAIIPSDIYVGYYSDQSIGQTYYAHTINDMVYPGGLLEVINRKVYAPDLMDVEMYFGGTATSKVSLTKDGNSELFRSNFYKYGKASFILFRSFNPDERDNGSVVTYNGLLSLIASTNDYTATDRYSTCPMFVVDLSESNISYTIETE